MALNWNWNEKIGELLIRQGEKDLKRFVIIDWMDIIKTYFQAYQTLSTSALNHGGQRRLYLAVAGLNNHNRQK